MSTIKNGQILLYCHFNKIIKEPGTSSSLQHSAKNTLEMCCFMTKNSLVAEVTFKWKSHVRTTGKFRSFTEIMLAYSENKHGEKKQHRQSIIIKMNIKYISNCCFLKRRKFVVKKSKSFLYETNVCSKFRPSPLKKFVLLASIKAL